MTERQPLSTYTRRLDADQQRKLRSVLEQKGCTFRSLPHAEFSTRLETANLTLYQNGKLLVQGKGTEDFVRFVLETEIIRKAELGYESLSDPDRLLPRLGVDESGKGDFFGPLCIAGVYVNESIVGRFETLGVKDSKHFKSAPKITALAKEIIGTPGCVYDTVVIGNEAYNRMYRKLNSINRILAWGHARVIENLLGRIHNMTPPPTLAVCDQFANTKKVIDDALMTSGRKIELKKRHRAESDFAVAAASILARHEFVNRLRQLERQFDRELPKGGSKAVDTAGIEFVRVHGEPELGRVAKLHFRNAYRALGRPEPPRRPFLQYSR